MARLTPDEIEALLNPSKGEEGEAIAQSYRHLFGDPVGSLGMTGEVMRGVGRAVPVQNTASAIGGDPGILNPATIPTRLGNAAVEAATGVAPPRQPGQVVQDELAAAEARAAELARGEAYDRVAADAEPALPEVEQQVAAMGQRQQEAREGAVADLEVRGPGEQRLHGNLGRIRQYERESAAPLAAEKEQRQAAQYGAAETAYETSQDVAEIQARRAESYWNRQQELTQAAEKADEKFAEIEADLEEASKYRGYGETPERLDALFRMRDSGDPEMAAKANAELKRLKSKDPAGGDVLAILGIVLSMSSGKGAAVGGMINSYINRKVSSMQRLADSNAADYKDTLNLYRFYKDKYGSPTVAREMAFIAEEKALGAELEEAKQSGLGEQAMANADVALAQIEQDINQRRQKIRELAHSQAIGTHAQIASMEQKRAAMMAQARGGTPPPKKTVENLGNKTHALKMLKTLKTQYAAFKTGDTTPLLSQMGSSIMQTVGLRNWDPFDAAAYNDARKLLGRIIGRMYETGKFSDQDAKFWQDTLPHLAYGDERAEQAFARIEAGLRGEVLRDLEANATAGHDVAALYRLANSYGVSEDLLSAGSGQGGQEGRYSAD